MRNLHVTSSAVVRSQIVFAACVVLTIARLAAQPITSGHLNVGAPNTNAGSQLNFVNGSVFIPSSGYVPLTLASTGTYAGYFVGGPTLTALPQTLPFGGPNANAPSFGSFVQVQMTLLSAPLGGAFAFWDSGAASPTYSLSTLSSLSPVWNLSGGTENPTAGTAGADPFGHVHGRRFTATEPGEYLIGFQAFDTSANGAQHTPSSLLQVRFTTVPEPSSLALLVLGGALAGAFVRRRRRGRFKK